MPVARQTGQRIRAGLWTSGDVGSAYAISALSVASDQRFVEWVLDGRITTPIRYTRYTPNGLYGQMADGYLLAEFGFSYMTFGMMLAWDNAFLPSSVESASVTVMHYDRYDVAKFVQFTINKPIPGQDFEYAIGGYQNVIYRLTEGTEVA